MTAPDQDILNYLHGKNAGYLPGDRYNLFARFAHQHGVTYEEVRDQVAVIHFTGDKPWVTTALHFDIEQLWWDYARLTPHEIYHQLLEEFQISTINDPELEQSVKKLVDDNNRMVELSQKLLGKFQNV
jgi:lipopolysaccharide biosynthesis glycosyltransferase